MQKPARSPVLGYNHNVKYRGRVFHVQTEDSGPVNPRIFTHLYFGGTILASKRHEYDGGAAPEIVRALMQSQHKSILKDLKNGRHDAQLRDFFAARGETLEPAAGGFIDEDAGEAADDSPLTPEPLLVPVTSASAIPIDASAPNHLAASVAAPVPSVAMVYTVAAATPGTLLGMPTAVGIPFAEAHPEATAVPPATIVFEGSFDDDPTNPDKVHAIPAAEVDGLPAVARRRGTPALGSTVRVGRVVSLGNTPTPTPLPGEARARRPARSIPYVVSEGSHPVVTPPPVSPVATAPIPIAPLPANVQTAPLTASELGATPTATASAADSQSLDEVIMAYLSRGVGSGDVGVG